MKYDIVLIADVEAVNHSRCNISPERLKAATIDWKQIEVRPLIYHSPRLIDESRGGQESETAAAEISILPSAAIPLIECRCIILMGCVSPTTIRINKYEEQMYLDDERVAFGSRILPYCQPISIKRYILSFALWRWLSCFLKALGRNETLF